MIAYSAINLALWSWLIFLLLYYKAYQCCPKLFAISVFLIILVFPAVLAWLYVKLINWGWVAKRIVHPIKRPWDWFFSKRQPVWIIVTLKDGRKIGGIYSDNSYASSFPASEQLYLEKTWRLDGEGRFMEPIEESKGILIVTIQHLRLF